jgi:hypothetical protein
MSAQRNTNPEVTMSDMIPTPYPDFVVSGTPKGTRVVETTRQSQGVYGTLTGREQWRGQYLRFEFITDAGDTRWATWLKIVPSWLTEEETKRLTANYES